jgi:hypothetical protein
MKLKLSVCITVIGMCLLIAGPIFADGGGAKSVDENVYGIGVNRDCGDKLLECDQKAGLFIEGYFTAHQETNGYIAHVSLETKADKTFTVSDPKNLYFISIPFKETYQHICAYNDQELLERFEAFACKKTIDQDYGEIHSNFQARVVNIHKTSQFNCNGDIDKENKPMIAGTVLIQICPLKK